MLRISIKLIDVLSYNLVPGPPNSRQIDGIALGPDGPKSLFGVWKRDNTLGHMFSIGLAAALAP